ncbi:MAG TPA: pyruvate ferredoxin oxidoreductase subunit gamma [Thermoplasmatales archaeon]|nr:pyruvate ferredoxin oxidoreductase subunit gamma [Thermoplasmatales archaeon]
MYEVRFHGRGGQGAVTAANILAIAAFKAGKYTQSFPFFGVERRGAPVMAFTRMDDVRIRIKMQVYEPDAVVVLDPSLLEAVDITSGLKDNGIIVINSKKSPDDFDFDNPVATVDATSIALEHGLGSKTAPIVNTSILGAYARAMEILQTEGHVPIEHVLKAVEEKAPVKAKENVEATREAYEKTEVRK